MIILNHKRVLFAENYCFSDLYFNGLYVCNLLEDADRDLTCNDTLEGIKK